MEVVRVASIANADINEEIIQIFSPLLTLNSKKLQVFLHGSWSDNSTTSFSDIDDFIVVDDDYYHFIKQSLDEVELNFQKKDPLQHHGHWLIKKSQLDQYDNSYIPLFIIKDAVCLLGSNQITANISQKQTLERNIRRIKSTCKNITSLYNKYKQGNLNLYDLKRFVGSVVLLPPLIFQIKGQHTNKRKAILDSHSLFSTTAQELIKWSSECRENWNIVIENESFTTFSQNIDRFNDAGEWRQYAAANAPVLNYVSLSSVQLSDHLIEKFIEETLRHIDEQKFQKKELKEYEEGFEKVKNLSIANKALMVGRFGSIKYPSISDLDIFICFKDHEYKQGCLAVDSFIRNDESLSYIFTHSPLYVCESMLYDIKFIHTLYELNIVYNPGKINLDISLTKEYQDFLNMVWSYLIMTTMKSITKNIQYHDLRVLMLSLKNAQTSIVNLELRLGIISNELQINHRIREMVLEQGVETRKIIESEYFRVFEKLSALLLEIDKTINLKSDKFTIAGTKFRIAKDDDSLNTEENVVLLNKVFFKLILDIYKGKDSSSRKYLEVIRKNARLHKKLGGYINTYIWIVPSKFIKYNIYERLLLKLKSLVKRVLKKN